MTPNTTDQWSTGRLVPAQVDAPGSIEVDCSTWEVDIPTEQWSTGRFESACRLAPGLAGEIAPGEPTGITDAAADVSQADKA